MAKYDSQLTELKTLLPTAKSILIAIPANADIDKLAAGLTLFLTLESAGKQVSIVCDDTIKVSQSHLFGVDHIQKNIPSTGGGNLTLVLEGVAAADNTVPALEKLDWFAQGGNLNLVFHCLPGQIFQPAKITPHFQGSGFNLIFTVGAANLNFLGNIYNSNLQVFSGIHLVNIDNQTSNTSFGQTNVLDSNVSSISEIVSSVILDLGFVLNADTASNLLAGIFEATSNLTNDKANAETFIAVANLLRAGGRKPGSIVHPAFDWSALMPKSQPVSVTDAGDHSQPIPGFTPSPEERPAGEGVVSDAVEPEWLTPKIFKGTSIG